ncbi:transcriptional regulator FtsR [Gulosibacter faecalis]|uniref:MerR family transcriptional regulator n=1 Tax=Gulosibacter faecalis TaxID=272240 RepID=A0ABW5V2K1_9MICO|nr:MerR family transcriptional regulator [Gulosibacter faecalis]
MAASTAAAGPAGSTPKLSIGQVLQRLGAEHPELTPSKIRFLEEQGLVHPARTEKGYRKYSDQDVQRIRVVLSLQRDHYLPLKVIGEYLEAVDRGESPKLPGATAASRQPAESNPAAALGILETGLELRRDELLQRSGASRDLLEAAHTAGLIARAMRYGEDELVLLSTLVELEQSGIQPRHLRPYRSAAQHDLGLVERAITPLKRGRDASAKARADAKADELATALERVRTSLLRQGLRDRRG